MMEKLNKRQRQALRQIDDFNGHYSIYWTPKTRERLVELGLAKVSGEKVSITEAGKKALGELA